MQQKRQREWARGRTFSVGVAALKTEKEATACAADVDVDATTAAKLGRRAENTIKKINKIRINFRLSIMQLICISIFK